MLSLIIIVLLFSSLFGGGRYRRGGWGLFGGYHRPMGGGFFGPRGFGPYG